MYTDFVLQTHLVPACASVVPIKDISPAGAPDRFAGSLQEHGTSSNDQRKIHGNVAPNISQNHCTISSESGG